MNNDKESVLKIIADSTLPNKVKLSLAEYIATKEVLSQDEREDIATVFEIFAGMEEVTAKGYSDSVRLLEQMEAKMKSIEEFKDKRMSEVAAEIQPELEKLERDLDEAMKQQNERPLSSIEVPIASPMMSTPEPTDQPMAGTV